MAEVLLLFACYVLAYQSAKLMFGVLLIMLRFTIVDRILSIEILPTSTNHPVNQE